jgi:predicted O-linked N-acetylglucosamine transferase (SPINDLY family)
MSIEQAIDLHKAGRFAEAERAYRTILAGNPRDPDALHFYGVLRAQGGDLDGAVDLINRSLVVDPDAPQAHFHLAGALLPLGKKEEALTHYERAVALQPGFLQAQLGRIGVLLELGRAKEALDLCRRTTAPQNVQLAFLHGRALLASNAPAEALAAFDSVVVFKEDFPDAHYHRAEALHALGREEEALWALNRTLSLKPDHAQARFATGNVLLALRREQDAISAFEQAIALKADFAEAHTALAGILIELKRWDAALEASSRAIAVNPQQPDAHLHYGRALFELDRPEEALAAFDQAAVLAPDRADAHINRGDTLAKLGRSEEALAAFDRAIAIEPGSATAHGNRGNALAELDRLDEAVEAYQRAAAMAPDSAIVHFNLANAYLMGQRWQPALEGFDHAIALKPDFAEAWYNRSNALWHLDRKQECGAAIEKALAIDPNLGLVVVQHFFQKAMRCDWYGRELEIADLKRLCTEGRLVDAMAVLTAFDEPELHLKAARVMAGPPRAPQLTHARARHERLRIAYLSADFSNHPVALQIVDLLERHDRSRFEIHGICQQSAAETDIRKRLKQTFDHFDEVEKLSDLGIAKFVSEREIDIAIELGGHTGHARIKALAHKPAPIAVSYLGFAGSTGADYIDYLIADSYVVPEGTDGLYSEKIVRLPHCFFPSDTKSGRDVEVPTREEAGLPDGFVFCSFNNNYKITPELFDIWMRLLRAVDDSVLWFRVESPAARMNLRSEAERRGVDPYRLVFAEPVDRGAHFARFEVADLFLDSIPYNAHTTANDALRCGVPVLTCPGRSYASRVAASMLTTLGLDELITPDLRAYEATALELARSPARLAAIREKLRQARATSPLFDMAGLCRDVESAYQTMWDIQLKGQKPRGFSVNISGADGRARH